MRPLLSLILPIALPGVVVLSVSSPTVKKQLPESPVFHGITIEYDAAGNRIFRSKTPSVEVNPDHYFEPVDTMATGPVQGGDGEVPGEDPVIEP